MFSKGSFLAVSRNLNQTSDLVKWTAPVSHLWFKKEKKNTSHHMHESDITGGLFYSAYSSDFTHLPQTTKGLYKLWILQTCYTCSLVKTHLCQFPLHNRGSHQVSAGDQSCRDGAMGWIHHSKEPVCLCHVCPRCCCNDVEGRGHGGHLPHPLSARSECIRGGEKPSGYTHES